MPIRDPEERRQYGRDYSRLNRERLSALKKARRVEQREYIQQAKARPCSDCGVQYETWVMEFDHVREMKRYDMSRLTKVSASWATIKEEIAKCEVVCANCHRRREHARKVLGV